ncbi:hypothetical protein [Streptomyces coeruleorubidus]
MAAELPGEESLPLCRLRFTGVPHTWGFALYLAGNDSYRDNILPSGLPAGSPEEALDCAGDLHLNALAPVIRVPTGLIVLVGPPASGKTSFVRALVARARRSRRALLLLLTEPTLLAAGVLATGAAHSRSQPLTAHDVDAVGADAELPRIRSRSATR